VTTGAHAQNFAPFSSIEGSLCARAVHDDLGQIEHCTETPWEEISASTSEVPGSAITGSASVTGSVVIDHAPGFVGPGGLPVEAIEWHFAGLSTSHADGFADFDGSVTFTLSEAVRVTVRTEYDGFGSVGLADLGSVYDYSITIVPSPLSHNAGVLMPGTYTLSFSGHYSNIHGIDLDGGLSLLVRFEPAPCLADINGDGVIDNGDIAMFVTLFLAGC